MQTPRILSNTEFRTFWIKAASENNKFSISVGKGGVSVAFMSHAWDQQEHQVNYIAFSSGTDSIDGTIGNGQLEWKIIPAHLQFTTVGYIYKYHTVDKVYF